MKILFVTTCYPDEGNSHYCVFLEQQAKALFDGSNRVDVLFIKEGGTDKKEYVFNGVPVTEYPIRRSKKYEIIIPTSLSKSDSRGLEKIISGGYDIISFHFGGNKIKRSLIKICRKLDIPIVLHFHGLNVWYEYKEKYKLLYAWYRLQYKRIYKKANAAVGVSDKVSGNFSKRVKTVPVYTVYNGVDIDRFPYNNKTGFMKPLRLLCVANLIELKGQDLLIKAVAELGKKGIDCELTLVGKGPFKNRLEELAEDSGVSEKVFFKGELPYDEISPVMHDSDIFVMPSHYEALGCVYIEAMASGMITVGVKGQGIDELIDNNKNGFLVSPKSVTSIVETVESILATDPERISQISAAARETAKKFTWSNSAKSLLEVYEKTISLYREGKN